MNQVQVVVLVNNNGNALYPFSETQPAYLLPVSNKPILAYTLENLIRNHFSHFVFVCHETNCDEIEKYVEKKFQWPANYTRTLHFYSPENYESTMASLASLHSQGVLTKDILVVPGDLISECRLVDLIFLHSGHGNLMTVAYNKAKGSQEVLLVDRGTNNLLKVTSIEEMRDEGLKLKKVLSRRFSGIEVKVEVRQTNTIIVSQRLLPLFEAFKEEFSSLSREFVLFVIDHQFHKKLREKFMEAPSRKNPQDDQGPRTTAMEQAEKHQAVNHIEAYIFEGYVRRVRTMPDYIQANADAIASFYRESVFSPTENNDRPKKAEGQASAPRGPINILGTNADVALGNDIKKSIFGRNCVVKPGCKIENSILMNDVEVEEGCEIKNSVVGPKCKVKGGAKIIACFIGSSNIMLEKSVIRDDILKCAMPVEIEIIRKMSGI
jgi:translation initiation factor eIF-2B subunit epsilon